MILDISGYSMEEKGMRVGITLLALALLVLSVGSGNVLAVGYESYGSAGERHSKATIYPRTEMGLYNALKRASFVERYPLVLDEMAFTVRDILSQFGLAENRTP
jgi:hypothetical protein